MVDVPGGEVGQCPAALGFELDQRRTPRACRDGLVAAAERLQLGLLIGADDVFVGAQTLALEDPGVEVQRPAGLGREGRIAREDPRSRLPGLDRVLVQPAPDRRRRGVGDAALDHQSMQLSAREPAQRQPVRERQLARDRLDLGDLLWGENGAGDPRAACPSTHPSAARRTFVATSRQSPASYPIAPRSRCRALPLRRKARSARAGRHGTPSSLTAPHAQAPIAPDR